MGTSTNSFKYTAMLLCAFSVLSIGPATAFAGDDNGSGDNDLVRGKIVSYRRGSIVVTAPPLRGQELPGPPVAGANPPVLMQSGGSRPEAKTPQRLPFGYAPIPTGPL